MPFKNLTEEQRAAVEYSGNLLLTACPGSGKTKTLVSKLAYIIKNKENLGIGKRKVIALTYTNVAADTIIDRLSSYGISDDLVWVGTIHSFCLQWVIKPNLNFIDRLSKGYVIIDEHERERLIVGLKEKYNIKFFDDVITRLDINYDYQYQDKSSDKYKLVDEYHMYLRDNFLIDFDLILNISHRLLSNKLGVCSRIGGLVEHILVDEYQDTSTLQYEILKLIIGPGKTKITLIGDQEQAIYTGLGAEVKSKDDLKEYFMLEHIEEMVLTGCFRSSQKIIDFYKKYQDGVIDIKSNSDLKDFESIVQIEQTIHKVDLSNYIHEVISLHLERGLHAEEIVVLCPSWFGVMQMSMELDKIEKSYSIDGVVVSPIPKNTDNIWLSLVKLALIEPCADNYIKRRRLANELCEKLRECGLINDEDSYRSILRASNSLEVSLKQTIESWIESLVQMFCSKLGVSIEGNKVAKLALISLREATNERIAKYKMEYQASDLGRFFGKSKGIKITTCHSTKGDEYDLVICTGLLEGKIPHWSDVYVNQAHADYVARRLLYVIASRAKKHLYMISEKGHRTGKGANYVPTRQL